MPQPPQPLLLPIPLHDHLRHSRGHPTTPLHRYRFYALLHVPTHHWRTHQECRHHLRPQIPLLLPILDLRLLGIRRLIWQVHSTTTGDLLLHLSRHHRLIASSSQFHPLLFKLGASPNHAVQNRSSLNRNPQVRPPNNSVTAIG